MNNDSKQILKNDYIISDEIKENVLKQFKSGDFSIIDDFIACNLNNKNSAKSNILELNKLEKFLDQFNYDLNINDYISLLKNNILSQILKSITSEKLSEQPNDIFVELSQNKLVSDLVSAYCIVNNQEELLDDEIDDNIEVNYYEKDSLKTYISEIKSKKRLTIEEEKSLLERVSKGDKGARKILIERNLLLVVSVANRYRYCGLPLQDLISEGSIGLMKAVDNYDISLNTKLSSYAYHCIKSAILKYIHNNSKNIRVPEYLWNEYRKYNKCVQELTKRLDRNPTINEIAEEINLNSSKINELSTYFNNEISLNTLINDERNFEIEDIIAVDDKELEKIFNEELNNEIVQLFHDSHLSAAQIYVLNCRYGFNGNGKQTNKVIAKKLNISIQRVSKIEQDAIKKIRNTIGNSNFEEYLNNRQEEKNYDFRKTLKTIRSTEKAVKNIPTSELEKMHEDREKYEKSIILSQKNSGNIRFDEDSDEILLKNINVKSAVVKNYLYSIFKNNTKEDIDKIIDSFSSKQIEILYNYYKQKDSGKEYEYIGLVNSLFDRIKIKLEKSSNIIIDDLNETDNFTNHTYVRK